MDWILVELLGEGHGILRVESKEGQCTATVWDFKSLYVEDLSDGEVLKRAKEKNPSSEYDFSSLMDIFSQKPKDVEFVPAEGSGNGFQLNVKYYVEGIIPFRFYWRLEEGSSTHLSNIGVGLLNALKQSHAREKILVDLIERKDQEIQDYRKQDIPLINKFLETKVFNAKVFNRKNEWISLVNPESSDFLGTVAPDLFPKEEEIYITEAEDQPSTSAPAKPSSKTMKRTILKRIQNEKIGIKTAELRYSADSQDLSQLEEIIEPKDEPPEKKPAREEDPEPEPTSQNVAAKKSTQSSSQIKTKRRLKDVL